MHRKSINKSLLTELCARFKQIPRAFQHRFSLCLSRAWRSLWLFPGRRENRQNLLAVFLYPRRAEAFDLAQLGQRLWTRRNHLRQLIVGTDDVRWKALSFAPPIAPFTQRVEQRHIRFGQSFSPRFVALARYLILRRLFRRDRLQHVVDYDRQIRRLVPDEEVVLDRDHFFVLDEIAQRRVVEPVKRRTESERDHLRQHGCLNDVKYFEFTSSLRDQRQRRALWRKVPGRLKKFHACGASSTACGGVASGKSLRCGFASPSAPAVPDFVFLQEGKKGKERLAIRPREAEPEVEEADARREVKADRRPAVRGEAVPTAAPKDPVRSSLGYIHPSAAICWGAVIVAVPMILTPLPDIAVHIKQAPGIGHSERANLGCLSAILTLRRLAIRIISVVIDDFRIDCQI